jgi:hypothetical protein
VHAARMKEPWCLATSLAERTAQDVITLYGKRFSIEETFRDEKDIHFGLGLSATHVGSCDRRDRLLLLAAIAHALLTLLGAAGEKVGLDREFQTSPKRGRALSLFGQGTFWYGALPNMKDEKALLLMTAFDEVVREHTIFRQIFGIIGGGDSGFEPQTCGLRNRVRHQRRTRRAPRRSLFQAARLSKAQVRDPRRLAICSTYCKSPRRPERPALSRATGPDGKRHVVLRGGCPVGTHPP